MIFSSAIGVVNLFTPTSGAIMGGLALARIEWTTWLKFALKIVVGALGGVDHHLHRGAHADLAALGVRPTPVIV